MSHDSKPARLALTSFFAAHPELKYPANHVILAAYSTPPGVYFLQSGLVKQYSLSPDGDEVIATIYKPGSFFPMIWAMTDLPNVFFFETLEPSVVRRASAPLVVEFLKSEPVVLFDLTRRLYLGLDGVLRQLATSAVGTMHQKVCSALLTTAERFGRAQADGIMLDEHISHKHLAHLAGVTRESVTRCLGELQTRGVVALQRRSILVKSLAELRGELERAGG